MTRKEYDHLFLLAMALNAAIGEADRAEPGRFRMLGHPCNRITDVSEKLSDFVLNKVTK